MHILIAAGVVTGLGLLLVALVFGAVWLSGIEYDRHPWFRRLMNSQAAMVAGYRPADDDITPEYLSQIPGWDDNP